MKTLRTGLLVSLIAFPVLGQTGFPNAQIATLSKTTSPAPNDPNTLTPAEWQELRVARQDALRKNPQLLATATELTNKMRAFQAKMNAAMIKTDPNVASVVAKFGGPGSGQQLRESSQKSSP